jgi:hypothetical protein
MTVAANGGGAGKPTLDTLTTRQLQAFVENSLKKDKRWKDKDFSRAVLDPARLEYRKVGGDGKEARAYLIIWVVPVRADIELSPAEEKELRTRLREALSEAIDQGMLLARGAAELRYPILINGKTDPAFPTIKAKEAPKKLPPPRPKPPAQPSRQRYVWRFVPAPCGSCLVGWWVPVPNENGSAGEAGQKEWVRAQQKQRVQAGPRLLAASHEDRQAARVRPDSTPASPQAGNLASTSTPRPAPPVRKTEIDVTKLKAEDAPKLFWQGCGLYWRRDYAEALACLEAATKLADDARFWYFRALAERAQGQSARARQSLDQAVRLHREGKPGGESVSTALERVQGPARMWIRAAQGGFITARLSEARP